MFLCPTCQAPLSQLDLKSRLCASCKKTWQGKLASTPSQTMMAPDLGEGQDLPLSTIERRLTPTEAETNEDALPTYWKDLSPIAANPTVTLGAGLLEYDSPKGPSKAAVNTPQRSLKTVDQPEIKNADYDILSFAAEGSMGKVFLARQNSMQRMVAIKQLKEELAKHEKHRTKFLAEAAVTGELDHPNIVPVHDLGVSQNGELFYSMKMIRGQSWLELIDEKSRSENIEILLRVADAVAYGHSKNIIHRDLKPENVMLGSFGEVLVTDWGIAVQLEKDRDVVLAGTPTYMAPEMAQGPPSAVGKHSDIYLLGAILFQIVVGKAPHHLSENTWEVLNHAAANTIVETDREDELLTIAHQTMATKPQDRHPTVEHFQEAVRAYQKHAESIVILQRAEKDLETALATKAPESFSKALFGFQDATELWSDNRRAYQGLREATLAYAQNSLETENYELGLSLLDPEDERDQSIIKQLEKGKKERDQRVRRLKLTRIAAFALVSALAVSLTFFSAILNLKNSDLAWQKNEAEAARKDADEKRLEAEKAQSDAEKSQSDAENARKDAEEKRQDAKRAERDALNAKADAEDKRKEAVHAKKDADEQRKKAESLLQPALRGQFMSQIALAKSRLDTDDPSEAAQELVSLRKNELLQNYSDWEWDRLYYLCHTEMVSATLPEGWKAIAVSTDGSLMASARTVESNTEVQLWQVERKKIRELGPATLAVGLLKAKSLVFSPNKRFLAVGGKAAGVSEDSPVVMIYRIENSSLIQERVVTVADYFSATSKRSGYVHSLAFHPTNPWLLTAGKGPYALIIRQEHPHEWKLGREEGIDRLSHRGKILRVAVFAPDGSAIAVINHSAENPNKQGVHIWQLPESQSAPREPYKNKIKLVGDFHTAAFFPKDPTILAIGATDGRVLLWNWPGATNPRELTTHESRVMDLCFSREGERLVTASADHLLQVWERQQDRMSTPTTGWKQNARAPVLKGHEVPVVSGQFLEATRLISLDEKGNSRLWDIDQYFDELKLFHDGNQKPLPCNQAVFSPDGKVLATAGSDGYVRLWQGLRDAIPGVPLGAEGLYVGHPRDENAVHFHAGMVRMPNTQPQQTVIATFNCKIPTLEGEAKDGSLCFWNARNGQFLLKVHTRRAELMSTTPDSHYVALGRKVKPKQVSIWGLQNKSQLQCTKLRSQDFGITTTAFRPRTQQLFIGLHDNSGRFLYPNSEKVDDRFPVISKEIFQSRFTSRGEWLLVTGQGGGKNYLWAANPEQGDILQQKIEFAKPAFHLDTAQNSDTHRAVVVSGQKEDLSDSTANQVVVVEFQSGLPVKRYGLAPGPYRSAAISPDGKTVLAFQHTTSGSKLVQWMPDTDQQTPHPLSAQLFDTTPQSLIYLDQHRLLTYGRQSASQRLISQVWDVRTQRELARMASGSPVLSVRHGSGENEILAVSQSGIVYFWDVTDPRRPKIRKQWAVPGLTYVQAAAITQESNQIAMIGNTQAAVLNVSSLNVSGLNVSGLNVSGLNVSGSGIERVTSGQAQPQAVANSARGVAIAFNNGRIWVRRAESDVNWLEVESIGKVKCMCMAVDSSAIAVHTGDKLYLWEWRNDQWQEPMKIVMNKSKIGAIAFSKSKKRLLTGDVGGNIDVLQIDRSNEEVNSLFRWRAHKSAIRSLEFSAGGSHLASTSAKGKAAIWPTLAEYEEGGSE